MFAVTAVIVLRVYTSDGVHASTFRTIAPRRGNRYPATAAHFPNSLEPGSAPKRLRAFSIFLATISLRNAAMWSTIMGTTGPRPRRWPKYR